MPNMGKPIGRLGPVGVEHIYRDPDIDLPVELLVNKDVPQSRSRHWSISWTLGGLSPSQQVQRVLHIVREVGFSHYTNWGPKTRFFEPTAMTAIPIAILSRAQRQTLERIASSTEVLVPNGEWNCQDWIIEVLRQAVRQDLITALQRDTALAIAQQ